MSHGGRSVCEEGRNVWFVFVDWTGTEPMWVYGIFGASFERRPNARCLGQRFISARLSGLGGETRLRQYVWRRKTGIYLSFREICSPFYGWDCCEISRVISARLSGLAQRDTITSVGAGDVNRNIVILSRNMFAVNLSDCVKSHGIIYCR